MNKYGNNTACFISFAKLPSDTPLYEMHKNISIGFIINYETGEIIDLISSLIVPETKDFVKSILVGKNLHEISISDLMSEIHFRYHGGAQRAICVAFKQCYDKYFKWREEEGLPLVTLPSNAKPRQQIQDKKRKDGTT